MISMKAGATQEQVEQVVSEIHRFGLRADVSQGEYKTIIGLVGNERKVPFAHLPPYVE
jgi:3-deoxy-7-phosphoheptulonate synthase